MRIQCLVRAWLIADASSTLIALSEESGGVSSGHGPGDHRLGELEVSWRLMTTEPDLGDEH